MIPISDEVQAAFAREQAGLGEVGDARRRLLRSALEEARRPHLLPRVASAAATVAVAAAIAIFVLLTHGHGRPQPTAPTTIPEALTSGPAATGVAQPDKALVWLTGYKGSQGRITGVTVEVLDWTGRLRHRFDVPGSTGRLPNEIRSISGDGTRALLDDGSVIDETGTIVGHLPGTKTEPGPPINSVHWMADDRHVCATFSNEPAALNVAMPPKPVPSTVVIPTEPYQLPSADHGVTLKIFGLDGSVRSVATVGAGPQGAASGPDPDSTSVLACSAASDMAVVARYHDADTSGASISSNMTVSLWAIKLSTGAVLYHQAETRMALGRPFFFGSQNGKLAVEFLWNSKVWGSETDVVLEMPSGTPSPVLDSEPSPDTPAVSADGTRILRRVVDQSGTHTVLELLNATSGQIIRRVVLPGIHGATAVALPGGSSFMLQVENYLALVDGNGGVTLLHPKLDLGQNAPATIGLPPIALQN
jgi:hypothetical protein